MNQKVSDGPLGSSPLGSDGPLGPSPLSSDGVLDPNLREHSHSESMAMMIITMITSCGDSTLVVRQFHMESSAFFDLPLFCSEINNQY